MPEEEAFCVFVRLMQEYRLRELFKPSMAELGLCIYQFEYMLQVSRHHHPSPQPTPVAANPGCPSGSLTENFRTEKSSPDIPAQKEALVALPPSTL